MNIQIQLFAGLKDLIGTSVVTVSIPEPSITIEHLRQLITEQYPASEAMLHHCFFAKNQSYAEAHEEVTSSDEVAIIPPVSGGEPMDSSESTTENLYEVTYQDIRVEEVTNKVLHPNHGAALTFVGTTREYTEGKKTVLLEYEGYVEMAIKTMIQIGDEIKERWGGTLCAITHRLGQVGVGEISVVISVSSPHRSQSYEASRYAIDRLKEIVPIWKKEIWDDGSEWKGHQQGPWNPLSSK